MLAIMIPATLGVVLIDTLRHKSEGVKAFAQAIFGSVMRAHEVAEDTKHLSGASHMLIAACTCILFFPKLIAITAFSVLILSDTAAALVGRKYGKRSYIDKNKTVEGTLAFVVSGIVVVLTVGMMGDMYEPVPWEFYVAGIVGVVFGAHVEAISKRMHWDDNFSVPLSVGGMMLMLGFLTGSYLGL